MTISEQHFKELGMPHFGRVFAALDDVMRQRNVPCYLIGAAAKDLQALRSGIKPVRYTNDIDFAIMVPDHAAYQAIMQDLLDQGFHATRQPYRVVHTATDTVVDLLPYGYNDNSGFYKVPYIELGSNGDTLGIYTSFDLTPVYGVDESNGTRFATSTDQHFEH